MAPLRATALVGVGAVATLALSVIAAKAFALLLGPSGMGLLALMQSVLNLGVILGSVGSGTSVIRATARGDAEDGHQSVERAALLIGLFGAAVGAAVLVALRGPLAAIVFGSPGYSSVLVILAPALLLSVAGTVQIAVLTGLHRIRAVTAVNIGTSLVATGFGVLLVALFGEAGLAPALLATASAQVALSRLAITRLAAPRRGAEIGIIAAARDLVRMGLPVTGSQLAGLGAQLTVPILPP